MTKNITNRQLFFILLLILTAFSAVNIAKTMAEYAGTGYWIPILSMSIFFAFIATIIVKLNNMHTNKTLCDYSRELIGPFFTILVSLYYFIYLILISVFLINELSTVLQANYLKLTPIWATMLVGIPVYCYIAYKGINTLARMIEIFGVLYFIVGLAVLLLMMSQGKINRILPLFDVEEIKNYITAIRYAIFPFLGLEILLFIPMNNNNGKKAVRTAFFAIISVGVFYIIVIAASIMKVGLNSIVHYKDAVIVTVRDLEVPMLDFLKRLDILYLTIGFTGLFMSISLIFTIMTEILLKLFPKVKRIIIVILLGIVIYFVGLFVSTIFSQYTKFVNSIVIFIGIGTSIIIPSFLLILSKINKRKAN